MIITYTNEATKEFGNNSYAQIQWSETDGKCIIWVDNKHLASTICGKYEIGENVAEILANAKTAVEAGEALRKLTMSVRPFFK